MDPAKAIDEVISLGLASAMKQAGFKKSARTFRRSRDGAIQVVNVQASQSNGPAARFTVNLGVYRHEIAALVPYLPVTAQPKEYECVVRERIGLTMPKGADRWWEAGPPGSSDNAALAVEVVDAVVTHGLPWLDSHVSIATIRAALSRHPNLATAAAAVAAGDIQAGIEIAETMAATKPATATTARAWIEKVLAATAGA